MLRSISLWLLIFSLNSYANAFTTKLTANTELTNFTDLERTKMENVISTPWQAPKSKNEESQDRFDQPDTTKLLDLYKGPCTDHPND